MVALVRPMTRASIHIWILLAQVSVAERPAVKRDESGEIVGDSICNLNPGPVYAGGGYTLHDENKLKNLLKFPSLVNDVSTGGATPLHVE